MPEPRSLGYRMPAEWESHEGTWLSWPHSARTWVGNFGLIPAVFGQIVKGLCDAEKVHICVREASAESGVRRILKEADCDTANVDFYNIPTNDAWVRDHGPTFIVRDSTGTSSMTDASDESRTRLAVVDWKFNAWGGKYPPWDDDDAVPERIAEMLKVTCFSPRMVLEGGSIEVNGKGTVLTTESVLLNPNRNPTLSKKQIEDRLDEYLAAYHVIWLGEGIVGDDTDGHIDDLARFVNETTVVTVVEEDPQDVNYKALHENAERLEGACDQDGRKLTIVKLPTPGKVFRGAVHGERTPDERLPASYANFYIGNGAVLVPVFGHENDQKAVGILSEFFPNRTMIPIHCKDLVGGYGAIHCVTQQQPA